jgi:hypothetical protein
MMVSLACILIATFVWALRELCRRFEETAFYDKGIKQANIAGIDLTYFYRYLLEYM